MSSFAPTIKQPGEKALLRFEFGQPGGVAISTIVSAAITPAARVAEVVPLSIDSQIVGSTYAQLRLAGGTAGELYAVRVLVEDLAGNRFEEDLEVLCLDLSFRVPGGAVATYMSMAQFVVRVGIDEAVRLTDEAGTGAIDAARLEGALLDAQAVVDSYIGARFAVPLQPPVPAPIPTLTFDLALARLYPGELPAGIDSKREEALRMLRDLSTGRATIPVTPAPTTTSPAPVIVQEHERLFTRDRLKGF